MKSRGFSERKSFQYEEIKERLIKASEATPATLLHSFNSGLRGLNESTAEANRKKYGNNKFDFPQKPEKQKVYKMPLSSVTVILFVFFIASLITVIIAKQDAYSWITLAAILLSVVISQAESFAVRARENYSNRKSLETINKAPVICVEREGTRFMLPYERLVTGDIVHLRAGDIIPADVRILSAENLVLNQSQLTGVCLPVKKYAMAEGVYESVTDRPNLAFTGSAIISGNAAAAVIVTGRDTVLGKSLAK